LLGGGGWKPVFFFLGASSPQALNRATVNARAAGTVIRFIKRCAGY